MSKRSFNPADDTGDITVYIGTRVSPRLYQLLVEEATRVGLSHNKMIGQVLAERYEGQEDRGRKRTQRTTVSSKLICEEEEPHGSTDGEITVQTG
jgi:hypothetical protein